MTWVHMILEGETQTHLTLNTLSLKGPCLQGFQLEKISLKSHTLDKLNLW